MKLFKLITKNFLIIMRSKVSSLIIIFGPLLVMLLAGFAFNNSASFDLKVGFYSADASAQYGQSGDVSNETLFAQFENALGKDFQTIRYNRIDQCIDDVSSLKIHACLEFPEQFAIEAGKENIISIYVDNSKVNIVDLIQNSLNTVISVETSEISSDLTNVLIESINDVSLKLNKWNVHVTNKTTTDVNDFATTLATDKVTLGATDISYQNPESTLEKVDEQTNKAQESFTTAKSHAQAAITEIKRIVTEIGETNVSNGEVDDILEKATTTANSLQSKIDDATLGQGVNELSGAIGDVKNVISQLESKLSNAAKMKSTFANKYDGYATSLANISSDLNTVADEFITLDNKLRAIKIKDAKNIISPVSSQIKPILTNTSKLAYIFPSLMVLVVMFVCLMLASTIVSIEKKSPAKFRLFTTPTSDLTFVTSIFATTLLVAVFQIIVILLVAKYIFLLDVFSNWPLTIAILLLGAIIFSLMGMAFGYIFSNEQTTTLAAISFGSASILVSDIILPLESIPQNMREVIVYTPFVMLTTILRRSVLFNAITDSIAFELLMLCAYSAGLFLLIIIAHKILKVLVLLSVSTKKRR